VPFSESDAVKIRLGQAATVSVDALPNTKLAAHVISISPTATVNSGVVSYNAVIELDQLEPGLRPGMTATAQIVVSQVENAVGISSAALNRAGGSQAVTVLRAGKQVSQPVVTGVQGDNSVQIVSGLNPGDQVVIPSAAGIGSATAGGAAGLGARLGGGGLGGGLGGGGFGGGFGGGGGGGGPGGGGGGRGG
jgi:macrolide-specific efflux system membrane fusion protein